MSTAAEIAHVRETPRRSGGPGFSTSLAVSANSSASAATVQGDHVGALVGEALTVHPPGPLCGAGDHDDLVESAEWSRRLD